MSEALKVVLSVLATWRVTHLVAAEDGPWDVLVRLRRALGAGALGKLMDCFYCLSVWAAAPLAMWVGSTWLERAVAWPALSGAAILLERLTAQKEPAPAPAFFHEGALDEEAHHAVLREGARQPEGISPESRLD